MIDIKELDKAKVLQALHGASRSQGSSAMHDKGAISLQRANELINQGPALDFDYVDGRVVKCRIDGDEFDGRTFDRDNGEGAAESAIAGIRG